MEGGKWGRGEGGKRGRGEGGEREEGKGKGEGSKGEEKNEKEIYYPFN